MQEDIGPRPRAGDGPPGRPEDADDAGDRHPPVPPRLFERLPADIADPLVDSGADPAFDRPVLERLTHPDERVVRTTLDDPRGSANRSGCESTPHSDLPVFVARADS
jgi:precorrin-6B methylase 1